MVIEISLYYDARSKTHQIMSPFKSAGASVQSTTSSRGVRIIGSNAGYSMFRGSVKSTGYPLHSPVSPSPPLPCVTVCHHISTGLYLYCGPSFSVSVNRSHVASVICHHITTVTTWLQSLNLWRFIFCCSARNQDNRLVTDYVATVAVSRGCLVTGSLHSL